MTKDDLTKSVDVRFVKSAEPYEMQVFTVTDVVVNIGKCSCHTRPGYACHYCGNDPNHRDFCPHCGYPQRSKLILPSSDEPDGYK